jgi:site-specific DNA recombinase
MFSSADRPLSGKFHNDVASSVVKPTTGPTGPKGLDRTAYPSHNPEAAPGPQGPEPLVRGEEIDEMTNELAAAPTLTDTSGLEHLNRRRVSATAGARSRGTEAVLYLRVSTERQMHTAADIDEDGNSIATQREATVTRTRALKVSVAREFIEPGHSAQTIAKRPVFREMLRYIEDHPEVGYVVIYMRSRVFRNFTDAAITKRALLEKGVRLISAKEEFGEGYMADAMEAITDIMNEVQVRQSGEDIKVKMRHKAESGGTVGRAKLGYANTRKSFGGRLVNTIDVDPARAPLVRWAFESYASGSFTLIQLLEELTVRGLTTRATARWPEQPLSHSQLSQILHDPYYTGVVRYKGELFAGRHEPLISKELFLEVQRVLAARAKRGQRDVRHHHYLKGLVYCARCHSEGRRGRLVFTEASGNGGRYGYYICMARQSGVCDLPSIPLAEAEKAIAKVFNDEQLQGDFLESLMAEVQETIREAKSYEAEARRELSKQIKKLDVREERLLDLAADGELSTPKLKQRLQLLKIERGALEDRLSQTDASLAHGAQTLATYVQMLANPGRLYASADDSVRRELLDAFYEAIQLDLDDNIEASATRRDAIEDLRSAERAYRSDRASKSSGPHLAMGATALESTSGSLSKFFRTLGLSKTNLVAGTGFEPATSGL